MARETHPSHPSGFTRAQIVVHWVTAVLVIFQVLMGEQIGPAWEAIQEGTTPAAAELFAANVHVAVGISVFVLGLIRLVLRLVHGAPPLPAGQSRWQTLTAQSVHWLLYGVILAMPVSGAIAWFGGVELAGAIHHLAKPLIILAIVLHVAGALVQHFVKRTDVLIRMVRPQ